MKAKKQSRFKPGDRLEVIWRDSTGSGGWHDVHEGPLPEPPHVRQLGFYLDSNPDTLYLAQAIPDDSMGCQLLGPASIPTGCIVSIRKVK